MDSHSLLTALIMYGLEKGLLKESDRQYMINRLLPLIGETYYEERLLPSKQLTLEEILDGLVAHAVEHGIIEDALWAKESHRSLIMDLFTPLPSTVIDEFTRAYNKNPKEGTDYFYTLSRHVNYIQTDRVGRNKKWMTKTPYGNLEITINVSKPEKDPKEISKASQIVDESYPPCVLCKENEGFAGNQKREARQNLRLIPFHIGEPWYFQYSPYTYYEEHSIFLSAIHRPMKIDAKTFSNLLAIVDWLPHYFVGSNADLPIVGGSILSHDHYQGGHHVFPMEEAPIESTYTMEGFEEVEVGRLLWPLSVIRLRSHNKEALLRLSTSILDEWRSYSNPKVDLLAYTEGRPHNTITPIARKKEGLYELDLVLRNNRTTKESPLGIFHPRESYHHIKKENIGLIEVMGLAVLPKRLVSELEVVKKALRGTIPAEEVDPIHREWFTSLVEKYGLLTSLEEGEVEKIVQEEVGHVFCHVLEDAGVFKRNIEGLAAFDTFIESVSESLRKK